MTANEWIAQAQAAVGTHQQGAEPGQEPAAARCHPLPTSSDDGPAAEVAHRGRRRKRANRRHTPLVVAGTAAQDTPMGARIDCTREGGAIELTNPFRMGPNETDEGLRRLAVSMHAEWLAARSVVAGAMLTPDGFACPAEVAPSDTFPRGNPASNLTGDQAIARLRAEVATRQDLPSIFLVCSLQCTNRLCHTTALAVELRTILRGPDAHSEGSGR